MALLIKAPVKTVGATARLAVGRPGASTYRDFIFMLCFLLPVCVNARRDLLPDSRLLLVQGLAQLPAILKHWQPAMSPGTTAEDRCMTVNEAAGGKYLTSSFKFQVNGFVGHLLRDIAAVVLWIWILRAVPGK